MAQPQVDTANMVSYLNKQLADCQIAWMDASLGGDESEAKQYERVMDALYDFANKFFGTPIPAPGQGYQPSTGEYNKIVKQRTLDDIDTQMAALERLREEVKRS